MPHRPSAEILSRFDPERGDFLRRMFTCAKKGRKWFTLDVAEAAACTGGDRSRVVTALNYLEEQGDLELQATGVRRGYRIARRPGNEEVTALATRLQERFRKRENNDIRRIGKVVSLITHQGCKTAYLLDYFGEVLPANCGHCDFCLGETAGGPEAARLFAPITPAAIPAATRDRVHEVLAEGHEAMASPRQQARFFCGIRSPRASRANLHRHAAFGLLHHIPFIRVLEMLESS